VECLWRQPGRQRPRCRPKAHRLDAKRTTSSWVSPPCSSGSGTGCSCRTPRPLNRSQTREEDRCARWCDRPGRAPPNAGARSRSGRGRRPARPLTCARQGHANGLGFEVVIQPPARAPACALGHPKHRALLCERVREIKPRSPSRGRCLDTPRQDA